MDDKRFKELYEEFSKGYQEIYDRRPVIHKGYAPREPIYMDTFGQPKFLDKDQYSEYENSCLYNTENVLNLIFSKSNNYDSLKFVKRIDKSVLWNIQGYNTTLKIIYENSLVNYKKKLVNISKQNHVPVDMVNNDEYRKLWRSQALEFLNNSYSQLYNEITNSQIDVDIRNDSFLFYGTDFYSSIDAMSSTSPHYNRDRLTPRIAKKMFRKLYSNPHGEMEIK